MTHATTLVRAGKQVRQTGAERQGVFWIHQRTRLCKNLRNSATVSANDRSSAGHSFCVYQPERFLE